MERELDRDGKREGEKCADKEIENVINKGRVAYILTCPSVALDVIIWILVSVALAGHTVAIDVKQAIGTQRTAQTRVLGGAVTTDHGMTI